MPVMPISPEEIVERRSQTDLTLRVTVNDRGTSRLHIAPLHLKPTTASHYLVGNQVAIHNGYFKRKLSAIVCR